MKARRSSGKVIENEERKRHKEYEHEEGKRQIEIGLFAAMVVGLMNASSLFAAEKSWQEDTVPISPQGDQTVVRAFRLRDARGVHVPLVILDSGSRMDAVLGMEGCENCKLGRSRSTCRVPRSIRQQQRVVFPLLQEGSP